MKWNPMYWLASIFLALLAPRAATQTVHPISLPTRDILYDPGTRKIYASVPNSAGPNGNSIAVIDPFTVAVEAFVPIGTEPAKLARSDDGQYLYVALLGSPPTVRRMHLATRTPGLEFPLGAGSFGANSAEDIAVQPGNPGVIAVSLRRPGVSPRHGGVAIYDEGVRRASVTAEHTGSNVIEFSLLPNRLYGYNNESTEFGFRRMQVAASGVSVLNVHDTDISGFGVDIAYHQGVVYSTSGRAIEPETGATLGTFAGIFFADAVVPDSTLDRVYFLDDDTIHVYRLSDFAFLEDLDVPGVTGTPRGLVRWGASGLAFRTDQNRVFLLSDEPVRELALLPPAGEFLLPQGFDVALTITAPGTHVLGIASARVDGVDVTPLLRASAVPGSIDVGEFFRETLRFPELGRKLAERFGAGPHTLEVAVNLADGLTARGSATWTFLAVTENGARHGGPGPTARR